MDVGKKGVDGTPTSLTRIYGFVTMVTSMALFGIYLILAITPSEWLVQMFGKDVVGVQRLASAVPTVLFMTVIYVFVAYSSLDLLITPPLNDPRWLTDSHARPWVEGDRDPPVIGDLSKLEWSRRVARASLTRQAQPAGNSGAS